MRTQAGDHLHPTVRQYVQSRTIASGYDAHFSDNCLFQYDCEFIDEYLSSPGKVLDVGCGTGRHLTHLQQRGFTTFGVDLNPHMLAEAEANLAACRFPARLCMADMHILPLREERMFDSVLLMFSTLGLVQGRKMRRSVLASLASRLKPGGMVIAHFHNRNYVPDIPEGKRSSIMSYLRQLAGLGEVGDAVMPNYRGIQPLYLHSFSLREIRVLFARSRLKIIELRFLNHERNAPYAGRNPSGGANGFLVAARAVG